MPPFFHQLTCYLLPFAAAGLLTNCQKSATPDPSPLPSGTPATPTALLYRGADLSFSPMLAAAGTTFTDNGKTGTPLTILQAHGANLIRLRLWHTPADGHSGLAEVTSYARQVKQAGLSLLLDLHYSDSWADPGKQTPPKAWQGLSQSTLQDSVFNYTRHVLRVLNANGAAPDLVQLGNEINSGMLWDRGKVSGESNWPALAALLNSGISAVKAEDPQHKVRIMLHFAGPTGADWFFGHLAQQGVQYDIQGLSYYPQYHGKSLDALQQQLNALIQQFGKDILIAETAYPFTLKWNDNTNNQVGSDSQLIPAYPATPEGQQAYLLELRRRLAQLNGGHGVGFCYWAPDWVAYKGTQATDGSPWENLALFDFSNAVLPAMSAFAQ